MSYGRGLDGERIDHLQVAMLGPKDDAGGTEQLGSGPT